VFKILQIKESIPGCVNPTEGLLLVDPSNVHNDSNCGDVVYGKNVNTIEMCNQNSRVLPNKEVEGIIFPVLRSIAKEFSD
jgi:hypothetical protein